MSLVKSWKVRMKRIKYTLFLCEASIEKDKIASCIGFLKKKSLSKTNYPSWVGPMTNITQYVFFLVHIFLLILS